MEGRGPGSRQTQQSKEGLEIGQPHNSKQRSEVAQRVARQKRRLQPGYRFYRLYDKVYRADVLAHAYHCCRANKGAAGVDGQRFEDIEAYGVDRWLGELASRLRSRTYEPGAVKRVWIPKPNSEKLRPLGIPTITDRVVQTAALLVLEPINEIGPGGRAVRLPQRSRGA